MGALQNQDDTQNTLKGRRHSRAARFCATRATVFAVELQQALIRRRSQSPRIKGFSRFIRSQFDNETGFW